MVMKKNRTMIRKRIFIFSAAFLFFGWASVFVSGFPIVQQKAKVPAPAKLKEKDLPQKYREWLDLTSYIILPEEKMSF